MASGVGDVGLPVVLRVGDPAGKRASSHLRATSRVGDHRAFGNVAFSCGVDHL